MTIFNVTYCSDEIYHSNLVHADTIEDVYSWFEKNKPKVRIVSVHIATADDYRPDKPVIKIS